MIILLCLQSCDYSRIANPTRDTVEKVVATLEGAQYGLAFGSGMAAISTIFNMLKAGDHIVSSVDLYGGTGLYLKQVANRFNLKTTFVDDVSNPTNIENAIESNTKVKEILTGVHCCLVLFDSF